MSAIRTPCYKSAPLDTARHAGECCETVDVLVAPTP
jgi:hypothetical protein